MPNSDELINKILSDMKVELTDMFDKNFDRKGFFDKKWKPRKDLTANGSLLHVTGQLRRSIRPSIQGTSVCFTSALPYAEVHNAGGKFTQHVKSHNRRNKITGKVSKVKAHTRKMNMPKRQFVGDHPEVRKIVKDIVQDNVTEFFDDLAKNIRQQ